MVKIMGNPIEMDDFGGKPTIFGKYAIWSVISMDCCDYQSLKHQYHQIWSHFFSIKVFFFGGVAKNILTKQVEVE